MLFPASHFLTSSGAQRIGVAPSQPASEWLSLGNSEAQSWGSRSHTAGQKTEGTGTWVECSLVRALLIMSGF